MSGLDPIVKIYVYILDEGTDVWRPVKAQKLSNDTYKIISINKDPDDERWEFNAGDTVRCVEKNLMDGSKKESRIVAVERIK